VSVWALDAIALQIIATGVLVGVAASLVGTFLVLRGSAMLSDAISHAIVFGIAMVWLATGLVSGPLQILGAAAAGLLCVALTEALARTRLVKDDAAIGLVFPALFAGGVLIVNVYGRDVHIDEHTVLLGEIAFVWLDTVAVAGWEVPRALLAVGAVTLVNLCFVLLFFKELKLATFDPALASALGFAPGLLFYALLALTSVTAVASFDAVGAILFIAFVIVPPAAAALLSDRLGVILVLAPAMAACAAVTGYFAAVAWDVSIGGAMASMTGLFFALAFLLAPRHGLLAREIGRRRQRLDTDCRSLTAHLYNHEGEADEAENATLQGLRAQLHWDGARAQGVVVRALDRGLVVREGGLLRLTPKGRAEAEAIFAPWRRTAPDGGIRRGSSETS
jgi:manganese/zinc/iron transport system permease protein